MMIVKVALLQMVGNGIDQDANLRKGETFCRQAKTQGADIALFPEMWNIAYSDCAGDLPGETGWKGQAVGRDSTFVQHFRRLAMELEMAIAITYLEAWPGLPRNSVTVFDRSGREVLTYAKVHTCDFGFERHTTPGDDFHVAELEVATGTLQLGAMICYDREQPESARILMLKGADLVLVPNACQLEDYRLTQFKVRSYENFLALAMTNYASPQENGNSVIFDGMPDDGNGPRNICAMQADGKEGAFVGTVDIGSLKTFRTHSIWGNGYRRPSRYGLLSSTDVVPPFARVPDRR